MWTPADMAGKLFWYPMSRQAVDDSWEDGQRIETLVDYGPGELDLAANLLNEQDPQWDAAARALQWDNSDIAYRSPYSLATPPQAIMAWAVCQCPTVDYGLVKELFSAGFIVNGLNLQFGYADGWAGDYIPDNHLGLLSLDTTTYEYSMAATPWPDISQYMMIVARIGRDAQNNILRSVRINKAEASLADVPNTGLIYPIGPGSLQVGFGWGSGNETVLAGLREVGCTGDLAAMSAEGVAQLEAYLETVLAGSPQSTGSAARWAHYTRMRQCNS